MSSHCAREVCPCHSTAHAAIGITRVRVHGYGHGHGHGRICMCTYHVPCAMFACTQVLLFAPDAAGLRAFPADHPYDSRSQVDLEAPTDEELRLMLAQGALASLQAGE